jgi:hypothetical protein
MARGWLAIVLISAGCAQAPAPSEDRPAAMLKQSSDQPRPVEIRTARAQIRAALERPLPSPKRLKESRCSDLGTLTEDERELSLRVVDARYDTRSVLPLSVTRNLTEPDLNQLDSVLAGIESADKPRAALDQVARFSKRRFVGTYHVMVYGSPKWFVKAGKLKPSWDAGRFDAWFAVHDAATGLPRCAARVTIIGDASGAPLRARLRSETRDKLTSALGERARQATSEALARIAPELRLPAQLAARRSNRGQL